MNPLAHAVHHLVVEAEIDLASDLPQLAQESLADAQSLLQRSPTGLAYLPDPGELGPVWAVATTLPAVDCGQEGEVAR